MWSSEDKFRKLLAAYEDEVQRKQHKMSKRVDLQDHAQPNPVSGYCTFVRGGQQVVWSPSFDVIGTYELSTGSWLWGWADQTLEPRVYSRMEGVRKQATEWGIDLLTSGMLTLESEDKAWELSVVAVAIARADAIYKFADGGHCRFLALFDAPSPTKSTLSLPTSRDTLTGLRAAPPSPPHPTGTVPLGSGGTGGARTSITHPLQKTPSPRGATPSLSQPLGPARPSPSSPRTSSEVRITGGTTAENEFTHRPTATAAAATSSVVPPATTPVLESSDSAAAMEHEPSPATCAELGDRMRELVPHHCKAQPGTIVLIASPLRSTSASAALAHTFKITLRPDDGGADITLAPTPALQDCLRALWFRCRQSNGAPYRVVAARLRHGTQGATPDVTIDG